MNTMELSDSIKDYYRLLMASKNEKSVKQKNRYDVVLLYMEGYSRKKISEILHIPLRTVSYHILSYEKGGMESLLIVKQPGAQKKLTDEQETELLSVISTQTPEEAGLGVFANWTAALACAFVKQKFGISYSSRGMLNLFDRLGLSYTRPTYTLDKADPKKQEQFRKTFETLKKLLEGDITTILFEDESMIRDYQAIMKTWFPKGKQRIIPTYGKHEGVKLVGLLDYETGHVYVEEHKKYDAEVFLQFLKNVLSQYPNGKTVIILDNARIHHAKLLKEFLDKNKDCLELVYLPPYSPNLNKIEELWGWLKDSVINNVFFHSREEIQKAVQKFIDWVTTVPQMVIDRLCL
jgi:transposase